MFGVGLDDGDGADGEKDDIVLLNDGIYKFRWAQYQYKDTDPNGGPGSAFKFVDKMVIEGKAVSHDGKVL